MLLWLVMFLKLVRLLGSVTWLRKKILRPGYPSDYLTEKFDTYTYYPKPLSPSQAPFFWNWYRDHPCLNWVLGFIIWCLSDNRQTDHFWHKICVWDSIPTLWETMTLIAIHTKHIGIFGPTTLWTNDPSDQRPFRPTILQANNPSDQQYGPFYRFLQTVILHSLN